MAARWREACDREGGSVRHPPKTIRHLIKRQHEEIEAIHERQQAEKRKGRGVFYVGSQPPVPSLDHPAPQAARQKSNSPIPQELDNGDG
ncbi:hypothetical protein E4T38_03391 [Aureobasidium subglaciale]|nr:hypothetical protein E4T38_03391 [Aureobasidium subglaciale]KAI5226115.1 hypothetical protein E4T40_03231 [Aureobasidium subglaciale]KAI5229460.1 hypothetical protein E4T41_03388 [Aureobasidium subglaciale]KAI5264132.1 hypothetical protein E4T46_03166 [Aureobasidium subglaciale]